MKKILLLILALVLCLGIVSCVESTETPDDNTDTGVNDGTNTDGGNDAAEALQSAIDFIWANYNTTDGSEVRADFDRTAVVIVGDFKYSVVWTTDNEAVQVVEKSDTAVTVKIPEVSENLAFKLTATISDSEGNSKSVSFDYTVVVTTSEKPVAGTAYKLSMVHTNLDNKVLYITGGMSGYYMATTEDVAKAVNIYVEEVDGGYYMYYKMADTGAKKYINMVVSGSYVNAKFEDTASTVYVYDEGLKTLKASVNEEFYVHGTSSSATYTTLGPVKVSTEPCFAVFELAPDGGVGGDHSHEFTSGKCPCGAVDPNYVPEVPMPESSVVEAGKGYYIAGRNSDGILYFSGSLASGRFNAVASKDKAVVVFAEATEGGFLIYFDNAGEKTYIVMGDSSTGGAFTTDKASATVFEWNAEKKTLVVAEDSNNRAFGMDDTKNYTTFSCYDISNAAYNYGVFVLVEGATPPAGGETPDTPVVPDEPEHTHSYVDGKCECGAEDPDYVPPVVDAEWVVTTELKNGDLVLIGAASYGKLLSSEKVSASSFYNKGVNYTATDFSNVTDAEIFVVTVNDDGSYTFTSLTGKVIALADSYSSLNDTGANKSWVLEAKGENTFLVKNTVRGSYLEWYSSKDNWSTYTSASDAQFEMTFYVKASSETPDTPIVPDEPEHTHSYVDGKCECGAEDPDYVPDDDPVVSAGGSVDFDTITTSNANGDSGYTNSYTTATGWVVEGSAIQTGGASVSNPQFPVIGADNTSKAICLTGKTSAPGKLTSPTLNGGVSKITMKYTKMFTDTKLSVTIKVTDLATGTVYESVVARDVEKDTDKYVVWDHEFVLETPITGDFTIEVVNNCPSANTGNKDRFTILDLSWVA